MRTSAKVLNEPGSVAERDVLAGLASSVMAVGHECIASWFSKARLRRSVYVHSVEGISSESNSECVHVKGMMCRMGAIIERYSTEVS